MKIITMPVTSGPTPIPSVIRDCVGCGAEVFVAYSMQPRVDSGELEPYCLICAREDGDVLPTQPPTPEQLIELENANANASVKGPCPSTTLVRGGPG